MTADASGQTIQRKLTLAVAIICLAWGGVGEATSHRIGTSVTNAAILRVGLVLLACWIAYPVIRRPAAWLPAGTTSVALLLLGAVVFQPRLLIVLAPLFGTLLVVGAFIRSIRRGGS